MALTIRTHGEREMKPYVSFCLQVALVGRLWGSVAQESDPRSFLEKYNSWNKQFETVYYDLDTTRQSGSEHYVYTLKHCSCDGQKQWIGRMNLVRKDGTFDEAGSTLVADIFDDKRGVHLQHYSPEAHGKRPPRAALFGSSRDGVFQEYREVPELGGPLSGRFSGSSHHSVFDLLNSAPNLRLQNAATRILGHDAFLVEGDTQYGAVRAWISPDLDYSCLKWEITKRQDQFYRDGATTSDVFTKWTAVFDAEHVEQIDGQYVITRATFTHEVDNGDRVLAHHLYHYNLKNVTLHPDYEALGAFKIQLPEGTVVRDEDIPGVQYQWVGGRLQALIDDSVINAIDSVVDDRLKTQTQHIHTSDGDDGVRQPAALAGDKSSGRETSDIDNGRTTGIKTFTKIGVASVLVLCVALVMALFIYNYRRKVGNHDA
jgi:hypothetical protein